jgi:hypothetical protein
MEAAAATERRDGPGLVGLLDFCKGVAVVPAAVEPRPFPTAETFIPHGLGRPRRAPRRDEAAGAAARHF